MQYDVENEYHEKHHIVPRAFNGSDSDDNLIKLPVRIHIFCHELLFKYWNDIAKNNPIGENKEKAGQMALALRRLQNGTSFQKNSKINFKSKLFAEAKKIAHETLQNMVWVNDGAKNTMIDKRNIIDLPDNLSYGMIRKKTVKRRWITDGSNDVMLPISEQLPNGYFAGRSYSKSVKKIWITDGAKDRYIEENSLIPDGWHKGRSAVLHDKNGRAKKYKIFSYNGKMYSKCQLAAAGNTSIEMIDKLLKNGYTVEQIMSRPKYHAPTIFFLGKLCTVSDIARKMNINCSSIKYLLNKGMTIEETVNYLLNRKVNKLIKI